MTKLQVVPLTPSQKSALPQLSKDFRAALSYVSFYSIDSPFVTQAVKKLHQDIQLLLSRREPLLFKREDNSVTLNEEPLPESETFAEILANHACPGFLLLKATDFATLVTFLRKTASPSEKTQDLKGEIQTHDLLKAMVWADNTAYEMQSSAVDLDKATETETAPPTMTSTPPNPDFMNAEMSAPIPVIPPAPDKNVPIQPDRLSFDTLATVSILGAKTELLLGLLAEAWQYSQVLKRYKTAHPETQALDQAFDRLFTRMLTKLENLSPEFTAIHDWFTTPEGEPLQNPMVESMRPLMEVAVQNGWTSILGDPATEGLVVDCLTTWGATGKHDLVEKTVTALSESLLRPNEKRLALIHLRDSRPWIRNPQILRIVLRRLVNMIAGEAEAATYQTALLLAWDLLEPAIETLKNEPDPVLALLSTLQLHAEDDAPLFKERPQIARYWLYEKTHSEMMRRLVLLAKDAGKLKQFSVLGMAAAPLLVKDFYGKTGEEKAKYLEVFKDIQEAIQAVVIEILAETENEEEIRYILPVIRACGLDASLAMLLAPWVANGSRELKMNIIGTIENLGDVRGGPALRLAVLDDEEVVAEAALQALEKINFTGAGPLIIKACQIRRKQHPDHEKFLATACQILGRWTPEEAVPFLLEMARKKSVLPLAGRAPTLAVRLAAIQALGHYESPQVWQFMERLTQENNPDLQELLDELIRQRISDRE